MRIIFSVILALLLLTSVGDAQAAARGQVSVQTPSGEILVESFESSAGGSHPAVLILSGSKGFGSPAYDEIGRVFSATGLDTYLVHVLSQHDLEAITSAGNARARIGYYAQRQSDWIAAVHAVVSYLNTQPRHIGRVGVLGISLGAQIAAASAAERTDIGALVLVDGGFPEGYSRPVRSLPPLQLIWGSADRTLPLSIGQGLHRMAQDLGWPVRLNVYEGGAHDFFLKSDTQLAGAAHQTAADFFATQLSR
jgi:dienelactone hydrolase